MNDVAYRENFVQRLGELAAAAKTAVYAWVLMTSDAQILVCSSEMGLAETIANRTPLVLS